MINSFIENTASEIREKVVGGNARVIVSMPVGMGASLVLLNVIQALTQDRLGTIAFISEAKLSMEQMRERIKEMGVSDVDCFTLTKVNKSILSNYDIVILFNTRITIWRISIRQYFFSMFNIINMTAITIS